MDNFVIQLADSIYQPESIRQNQGQQHSQGKLELICKEYKICDNFRERLRVLKDIEIVVICDDSGSMKSPAEKNNPQTTRWDELKHLVRILVDIASVIDDNGIDIYFLNRPEMLGVKTPEGLEVTFNLGPNGPTPITPVLKRILKIKCATSRIIMIATDGLPTMPNGNVDIDGFKHALRHDRHNNDYTTILACTEDKKVMSYLNNWDKEIPRLDVIDDYRHERKEVLKAQGPDFPFSFGDYIVKALLGSYDKYFDQLDEKNLSTSHASQTSQLNYSGYAPPHSSYNGHADNGCVCLVQ